MKSLSSSLLSALALPFLAQANPVPAQYSNESSHPGFVHPSNGDCKDMTLQLPVTFPEMTWSYPPLKDDYDSAALVFNYSAKTGTFAPWGDGSSKDVTKTFEISGTYCAPAEGKKGGQNLKKLLIMTHGAGFDRR